MKSILSFAAVAFPLCLSAQSLSVSNPNIDLGQILFMKPATVTFTLKNMTSSEQVIKNVDTGCGCARATVDSKSIPSNGETKLYVTYDAKQLGHFTRLVTVNTEDGNSPLEVSFSGNVVTNVENYSGEYPYNIDGILCNVSEVTFDDVVKGKNQTQEIQIMNPLGQYIEPVIMHLPPYIRAEVSPAKIAPKKSGVIKLHLKSNSIRSYGLSQASIYLAKRQGENVSEDKEIPVSVILLPATSDASIVAGARMPKISLSEKSIDMTDFAGKEKKKMSIIVSNNGTATLDISSIQMFTPGLEINMSKSKLLPGTSAKMTVTGIASILKKQKAKPRILMITNDPNNQKVVIEVNK